MWYQATLDLKEAYTGYQDELEHEAGSQSLVLKHGEVGQTAAG